MIRKIRILALSAAPAAAVTVASLAFAGNTPVQKQGASAVPLAADSTADRKGKDIVDTAVAAGKFNTLAAALKAAGLVDTLKGDGPFTVFAPTDDAFAKLP